jgi:peroxiredoxin
MAAITLSVGEPAPPLIGSDDQGHRHRLSDYRGQNLLLLFLGSDHKQLRAVRAAFLAEDIFLLGVGAGPIGEVSRLKRDHGLQELPVLIDHGAAIAKAYGFWREAGGDDKPGGRESGCVLIDAESRVLFVGKRTAVPGHLLELLRKGRARSLRSTAKTRKTARASGRRRASRSKARA